MTSRNKPKLVPKREVFITPKNWFCAGTCGSPPNDRGVILVSTDDAARLPRRKRSIFWLIGGIFVMMLGLFLYQLLGPNPPIIISKETTYITAPLWSSGLPDYERKRADDV